MSSVDATAAMHTGTLHTTRRKWTLIQLAIEARRDLMLREAEAAEAAGLQQAAQYERECAALLNEALLEVTGAKLQSPQQCLQMAEFAKREVQRS